MNLYMVRKVNLDNRVLSRENHRETTAPLGTWIVVDPWGNKVDGPFPRKCTADAQCAYMNARAAESRATLATA